MMIPSLVHCLFQPLFHCFVLRDVYEVIEVWMGLYGNEVLVMQSMNGKNLMLFVSLRGIVMLDRMLNPPMMIVYLNGNEVWSDDRFVDQIECIEYSDLRYNDVSVV